MKIILYILLFLLLCSCKEKQPELETLEMNSFNLELLALKSSSKTVVNKYVMNLIKTQHAKEYYPIIKDNEKVDLLVKKHTEELLNKASKLSENTNFKITRDIHYVNFDYDTSKLTLKNFLYGNTMPISNSIFSDNEMPSTFLLLFPTTQIMNDFEVNSKKFQSLIDNNKYLKNKSLFMEIIVNLVKFQNTDNFQTIIKRVNIYESSNKEFLLASKSDTSTTIDDVNNWLLADGYTNKLFGIHSFSFFGNRLQDQLRTASSIMQYCDKTQKLGIHQVIVCNQKVGDTIFIVTTYIGGIVGKVDLVAESTLSDNDRNLILQKMKVNLNKPKSILNTKHSRWTMHHSEFNFYSDAFNGVKSPNSKYNYLFGTNKKFSDMDLTLVVSMISHETKNLIEKNK